MDESVQRATPPPLPPPSGPPPLPPPRPWNGWWTLLWGVTALGFWMGIQSALTFAYMIYLGAFNSLENLEKVSEELMTDGDFLGAVTLVSGFMTCPVCYYLGKFRTGFTGASYLGLHRLPLLPLLLWLGATFAIGMIFSSLSSWVGMDESPDQMVEAVESSKFPLLLVLGVVVGAPFFEEFVFRGLLFRGWRESRLGLGGTLVVTSVVFSGLHLQYLMMGLSTAVFAMVWIFSLSMMLGYARHITGSLWVPIGMHALNNGLATIEIYRHLNGG